MAGKVYILGSVNVDLLASVPRLPQAGETLTGLSVERQLGGKGGNQAVAAARAGADCQLLGMVGADAQGKELASQLSHFGVDTTHLLSSQETSGLAIILTSPSDNQIVVIPGANAHITPSDLDGILFTAEDICLTQLETPLDTVEAFLTRAREAGARTMLNPSPVDSAAIRLLPLVDHLVVNRLELAMLSDQNEADIDTDQSLIDAAQRLQRGKGQSTVVTLGQAGCAVITDNGVVHIAPHQVEVRDTTGAGDCFCGYLAAGLLRGLDLAQAATEANAAGALAVQKLGTAGSVPNLSSVLRFLAQTN